jgi:hypothetical protein
VPAFLVPEPLPQPANSATAAIVINVALHLGTAERLLGQLC